MKDYKDIDDYKAIKETLDDGSEFTTIRHDEENISRYAFPCIDNKTFEFTEVVMHREDNGEITMHFVRLPRLAIMTIESIHDVYKDVVRIEQAIRNDQKRDPMK